MSGRFSRRQFGGGAAALLGLALAPSGDAKMPAPLSPADFTTVLSGLDHPEGIATAPDGSLFFSSGGGALGIRMPDGEVRYIGEAIAPNGIAIDREGRAIVANMGLLKQRPGPLQRVDPRSGRVETLVDSLEGRQLVASNGPVAARDGSLYCTHSTWGPINDIGTTQATGFIYRVTPDLRADIVARDLRGVNGLCLDRDERWLYASLTASGSIRRWRRRPDGSLGEGEGFGPRLGVVHPDQTVEQIRALPLAERATLGYCDGIGFDAAGNLWITLPFANRLVALTPAGRLVSILHDPDGERIEMPTNLCWGGADLRELFVVSRRGGTIVKARTTVPGAPLANWPRSYGSTDSPVSARHLANQ
jgi:gluconolactonase